MAFTTGTTMVNPYVLNIVDLQNTTTNASGISLQASVDQLGQMIDFANKQVNADTIASFTAGGSITFASPTVQAAGTTTLSNSDTTDHSLYVFGNVYASNYNSLCPMIFKVHDDNNTEVEVMRITTEGNVGIGTFAPAERLAVAGGMTVSGNATIGGDLIVNGALIVNGRRIA
jgi:hypothetical protein